MRFSDGSLTRHSSAFRSGLVVSTESDCSPPAASRASRDAPMPSRSVNADRSSTGASRIRIDRDAIARRVMEKGKTNRACSQSLSAG